MIRRAPSSGFSIAFTLSATIRNASMSRPESVSSRIAICGSRTASWSISSRFFSPPLKPSLTYRVAKASSIFSSAIFSRIFVRKSRIETPPFIGSVGSTSPVLSMPWSLALRALRMKLATLRPGIAVGYWKARNIPRRARLSGVSFRTFRPCHVTVPPVTT